VGELGADLGGHRVEDLRGVVDRRLRPRELALDALDLAHRAGRALDRLADRGGVDALGLPARHQHPRASQRVRHLERQRGPVLRVEADHQLVPVELAQRLELGRHPLLAGDDEHGVVRLALREGEVQLLERLAARELRRLGLEDDAPARGPAARLERDHDVARAPRRALEVAHRVAVVTLRDRDAVERLVHGLLEGPALRGAAPGLGGDLLRGDLVAAEALDLQPQRGDGLRHLRQPLGLLVRALLHDRERRALEAGERVVLGVGRELLAQVLAHGDARLGEQRLDAVLHRDRGLVAEVALERLGDVPVLRAEHLVDLLVQALGDAPRPLDELGVQPPRRPLELRLDELGVHPHVLAVDDPRADLDRVDDHLRGVLAGLLPCAHERHRGLVVDEQAVDDHPVGREG
jgi:hypothetical protein